MPEVMLLRAFFNARFGPVLPPSASLVHGDLHVAAVHTVCSAMMRNEDARVCCACFCCAAALVCWQCSRFVRTLIDRSASSTMCASARRGQSWWRGAHTPHARWPYQQPDAQLAANQNRPDKFVPIHFDEAGHRVATQYLLSALDGAITFPHLKNYRVGHAGLPGHPELHCTPGVKFSSGRLGQVP